MPSASFTAPGTPTPTASICAGENPDPARHCCAARDLEYKIVGSQEADPMHGLISEESPFGRALMGKRVGDEITVEAPAGHSHYTILTIS